MKTRSAPFFPVLALALAASLVFTACGGGSDGAPIDATQPENTAFTLTLSADKALVLQGDSATLTVQLQRKGSFDGAVAVARPACRRA